MEDLYQSINEKYNYNLELVHFDNSALGFFEYYFKQSSLIRRFNERYNFLKVPFFSRNIQLRPDFLIQLKTLFIEYIIPIMPHLKMIIQKGWRWNYISVREYNLIVFLYDFCKIFEEVTSSKVINPRSFLIFEDKFIKLVVNGETIESIILVIQAVLKKNKDYDDEMKINVEKLKALFSDNMIFPSLFDFIISFNISMYKRYFSYSDLYNTSISDIVSIGFYKCPRDVFDEIVYRIESLIKDIKRLEVERDNLQWLKDISSISKNGESERVIDFYNKSNHVWEMDNDDFFKIFLNLMKEVLSRLDGLIYKDIDLIDTNGGINSFKLLNITSFDLIYQKLYNDFFQMKAKHLSTVSAKVTLDEFYKAADPSEIFNEVQLSVYDRIKELLKGLSEISLNINALLVNDGFVVKNHERNRYMITSPEEIKGKSPHQAIYYYLELFLQICGAFREVGIKGEIERLNKIVNNLEESKKELNRITDANGFLEKKILESGKIK